MPAVLLYSTSLATCATVYFMLPETQALSLEEIDELYTLKIKPWSSNKWQPPSRSQIRGALDHRRESDSELEMVGSDKKEMVLHNEHA